MTVHVLEHGHPMEPAAVHIARSRAHRRGLRFRLAVLAHSVGEVVESAGGLICDRVMNGWDVTVVTTDLQNAQAIRILGADAIDLNDAMGSWQYGRRGPIPHTLALSASLFQEEPWLRNELLDTINRGRTEVTMWGGAWPADLEVLVTVVEHRLTRAALAFKAHALLAAGSTIEASRSEVFRMGELRNRTPWPRDLAPAS